MEINQVSNVQAEQGALAVTENAVALIERYLSEADVAENTKETYRKGLKQFFAFYQTNNIQGISRADMLAYKAHLMETRRASTVGNYLSAIKGLFIWLEAQKLYPNVAAGIKGVRASKGFRKDALTAEQVSHVLATLKGESEQELRDFAIFNLLVHTALRSVELHRADICDIRTKGGQTVLYVHGKGRDHKDEFVVLTDSAARPIYAYLAVRKERNTSKPLFASLSNRTKGKRLSVRSLREIVKGALRSAGYDDDRLTTHSLRHTAVTLALLGGASLQQTQYREFPILSVIRNNVISGIARKMPGRWALSFACS